jgi:serine/threonine protein phosphatase PrpC
MDSDAEQLEVGALSETGYVREENQDRMSWSSAPVGHLYIVADGMGGHRGGALAAQMAVEELQRHIGQAAPGDPLDSVIEAAFKAANDAVYKRAHSGDSAAEGMGTTAVLLLVSGRVAKVAHVGDSRAYLYRDSTLSRLTTDHTVVQRMVEAGMLKPDEIFDHPSASVLERAIGNMPTVEVDIYDHQLQEGDALVLCSDGLCGYVTDAQIEAVLRHGAPVQETTANLVRLALETGGRDNITVQLIRYGARTPASPTRRTQLSQTLPQPTVTASSAAAKNIGTQALIDHGGPVRSDRDLILSDRGLRLKVTAFMVAGVITGAATAGGFFLYSRYSTTSTESGASKDAVSLQEKLDASNAAREHAVKQVAELERQRAAATQADKATMSKLEKDLEVTKQKAGEEASDLRQKLTTANAGQEKLRKELQAMKAEKEAAENRVRELQRELKERDKGGPGAPDGTTSGAASGNQETTTAPREGSGAGGATDESGGPKTK